MKKKVLVACEFSQVVMSAFYERGADAWSCDLRDTIGPYPRRHLKCDVHEVMYDSWDIVIAHPPCTYLSNAGHCVWSEDRRIPMLEAKVLFLEFLTLNTKVCVENPKPMRLCGLPKPTFVVNPYEYGDPYSKQTYFWLRGLPPFLPTDIVIPEYSLCAKYHSPKRRSIFSPGIAAAMAEAWL